MTDEFLRLSAANEVDGMEYRVGRISHEHHMFSSMRQALDGGIVGWVGMVDGWWMGSRLTRRGE